MSKVFLNNGLAMAGSGRGLAPPGTARDSVGRWAVKSMLIKNLAVAASGRKRPTGPTAASTSAASSGAAWSAVT
jgi:hypothetical protein